MAFRQNSTDSPLNASNSTIREWLGCNYCQPINISEMVPVVLAVPLYGYVMPIIIAVTLVTNSFIVVVLNQKHLRTPTNFVLLSMAVAELFTGIMSVPWFLYYYTLQGYLTDEVYGLPKFWCHAHPFMSRMLPTIWHTAAIWLTVFLAIQRYVYVCVPSSVHRYCTPRRTKFCIISIAVLAFMAELPEMLGKYTTHRHIHKRDYCVLNYAPWVLEVLGVQLFYSLYYWFRVICVHGIPCCMLLVFTCKLAATIKAAEIRKRSWVSTNMNQSPEIRRCSTNGPGRSMYATNRMLSVVITVFLLIEIPAAVIFTLHFLTASQLIPLTYDWMNYALILRNVLIVLTSPFNFAIYCSMSEQFRLTVKQLFSSRLLFVAQAQATFHGGKRYSLILVDVATLEAKQKTRRSSSRISRKSSRSGSRRSYRHLNRRSSMKTEGDDEQHNYVHHVLNKEEIVVIGERSQWTRQTSIPEDVEGEEQELGRRSGRRLRNGRPYRAPDSRKLRRAAGGGPRCGWAAETSGDK